MFIKLGSTPHLVSSLERPWIALAIDWGQNLCTELLVLSFLAEQLLAELLEVLWLWRPWLSLSELAVSNIGWRILRRAFINQLFTWSNVRFVCPAIALFSSSVGYGCCQTIILVINGSINVRDVPQCVGRARTSWWKWPVLAELLSFAVSFCLRFD